MEKFAERLTALRESRHMTKKELAALLNVSAAVVSQYEANDCMPGYDILIAISKAFNVTTDYLLGITDCRNVAPNAPFYGDVSYHTLLAKCDKVPAAYRDVLLNVIDTLQKKDRKI